MKFRYGYDFCKLLLADTDLNMELFCLSYYRTHVTKL